MFKPLFHIILLSQQLIVPHLLHFSCYILINKSGTININNKISNQLLGSNNVSENVYFVEKYVYFPTAKPKSIV